MDIQVGEYVRDCDGIIVLVKNIVFDEDSNDIWYEERILKGTWKSRITKHSKNIIDLIEVGDFVNGVRVLDVTGDYIHTTEFDCCKERLKRKLEIILTKEQYEANCYRLEG